LVNETERFLLEIKGLKTYFYTEDGILKAVDGVDFNVKQGEILGLVGESGCGKSVTALSIMQLVSKPGRIVEGEIMFGWTNLRELSLEDIQEIRGNKISMIFQQPQSSLNPVITVGDQLAEVFEIHSDLEMEEIWDRSVELLRVVGIPDPDQKAHAYPHEMSGGQAQRVMIAMALAMRPELLIADEPTTALDVTIQAQILDLIRELRNKMGTAVILITHDLGVVAEIADWVAVIDGVVPNLIDLPPGCRFAPRCQARTEYDLSICLEKTPNLEPVQKDHTVRCWLFHNSDGHTTPQSLEPTGLEH
jgi:oligopeptide/dipeptide ABC transporter ATP-binding protein